MAIEQVICYVAYCDGCGEAYEDGNGYIPHRDTKEEIKEAAENGDWWFWKDRVWCLSCLPSCKCGHLFGEHDYGEAPCQDCLCQEYVPDE